MVRICMAFLFSMLLQLSAYAKNADGIFAEFPAQLTHVNKNAAPKLQPGSDYWNYRTVIRAAAEDEPNFASHYIVVSIGCGTECLGGVLIDVFTGDLYPMPSLVYGALYQVDSSLLATGTCTVEDPPGWLSQQFYTWSEKTKEFTLIRTDPANTHQFSNNYDC